MMLSMVGTVSESHQSSDLGLLSPSLSYRTMLPSSSYNLLLLASLCCLLPGSQTKGYQKADASGHDNIQEPPQCQNFASTITNISLALLQNLIRWPGQTNIMFSPVGITAAFAMLSLGAKGSTQKQILDGLRFGLRDLPEMGVHKCFQHLLQTFHHPNYQLLMTTGNSLFIDKRLQVTGKFREVVTELYDSETIPVNFQDIQEAKAQINKHTMKRSYGHILQVVEDLPIDTALALVNFVSLDGKVGLVLGRATTEAKTLGFKFLFSTIIEFIDERESEQVRVLFSRGSL